MKFLLRFRALRILSYLCLVLAWLLLENNVIGLFIYNQYPNMEEKPQISEEKFWEAATPLPQEGDLAYAMRMNGLVHSRMLRSEPTLAIPTIFENYILWYQGKQLGQHEWISLKKAIRYGGGLSSQSALALVGLMQEQGIEGKRLDLSGHVVAELKIGGKNLIFDPDQGVDFSYSLDELRQKPEVLFATYLKADAKIPPEQAQSQARDMVQRLTGAKNPQRLNHDPAAEQASLLLIWLIPLGLLTLGGLLWPLEKYLLKPSSETE